MSENQDSQAGDESDDALRHWEERLRQNADPFGALVEVLGGSAADRNRLFRLTGTVLLGCTLEHMLGSGGGGVTYAGLASDGSRVAVKLVMAQSLSSVERFEQECRLLQSLGHPSIVHYHSHTVQEDGTGVLVMDLVDGIDLESLLSQVQDPRRVETAAARNPAIARLVHNLDLAGMRARGESVIATEPYRRRILRFLAIVAEGLHHAHERGVVHRDVKPPNILVDAAFSPVLIDFGLARDLKKLVSMTQSGIAIGTLAYMAPELLAGEGVPVDRRADVYSLGLVLYRATTGHDFRQVPEDVWRSRRRPFLLDPEASRELPLSVQAILYSCLDPRPERRYPDALRLAADLRAAAGDGELRARMPSWIARQCRDVRNVVAIVIGLVSALATVLWLQWPRGRLVEFVATCDPHAAVVVVDEIAQQSAVEVRLAMPTWLPLGSHTAKLVGEEWTGVQREFVVEEGHGPMRVAFATHRRRHEPAPGVALGIPVVVTSGHRHVQYRPGIPRDRIYVDGSEPAPMRYAHDVYELDPDEHVLRAVDGLGRSEEIVVDVGEAALDVQLLPACVSDVDGSFRRTWGTVLSPLPADVTLRGDAQPFVAAIEPSVLSSLLPTAFCALAPTVADRTAECVLRVDFPRPMRSAVVHFGYYVARGGDLSVELCCDGLPPQKWDLTRGDAWDGQKAEVRAPAGMRHLELRARIRSKDVRNPLAQLFRSRHFSSHQGTFATGFAVVADEGDAAVLKTRTSANPLREAAKVEPEKLQEWKDCESSAPVVLAHTGGDLDVLVSQFGFRTSIGEPVRRGLLRRLQWPSRREKSVFEAERMHRRVGSEDGLRFGDALIVANDRDGDGWTDFVVGDSSSDRLRARSQLSFARYCSSSPDWDWIWPLEGQSNLYDFSGRQVVLNVGDWTGDAEDDFAFRGQSNIGPTSPPGSILAVVNGIDAKFAYAVHSESHPGYLGCIDALPVANGPRPLLYWEAWSASVSVRDLRIRLGGAKGTSTGALVLPLSGHALLVPSRNDPAVPDLVVLRLNDTQVPRSGLERYELSGSELQLVDREPVDLPYDREPHAVGLGPSPLRAAPVQEVGAMVRTDDLDGDGVLDFAIPELAPVRGVGVLFVSTATLKVLARCECEGVLAAVGAWVPATSASKAGLLLTAQTKAGTSLLWIEPRR